MKVKGKVCVVTGAAGNVGSALARVLADKGACVVGVDMVQGWFIASPTTFLSELKPSFPHLQDIGKSRRSRWFEWRHGSIAQDVIRKARGVAVVDPAIFPPAPDGGEEDYGRAAIWNAYGAWKPQTQAVAA